MTLTTVFVTGASGFIAQHIIKQLLEKKYAVVGTVRSASKGDWLKEIINSENFSYEIVPHLDTPGAFDEALSKHPEVTVFIHTASPVIPDAKDLEQEILKPAIEGTKNALTAIVSHAPQVQKVVITSSIVSVYDFSHHEKVHTEKDWNPISYEQSLENGGNAYCGSKKFAELAVWDFVKENKAHFDVSFVLPSYAFGPQAYAVKDKSQLNLSSEVINGVLKLGPNDPVPALCGNFIDVRDVASAHIKAFEDDGAANHRLVLVSDAWTAEKITHIINEKFPELNGPKGDLEKHGEQLTREGKDGDFSRTKSLLGFEYISLEKSVVDCVNQILATE
ncbi:uncharacterized protein J8A68_005116 [[Candida] subhashii]|uniref:NAD-dependent epimerase/dehydratase domain-containing protein n=1 Tax=[Candida] subhashii TaxID=561895 RepID=A0A8J5UU21_9ASCO|nr:uncharacterized protein J8A68_005116 [[Candida] subhashii]KAG7661325.1 hypothetical protein J8A68_005116 [[Candida] subhashii]